MQSAHQLPTPRDGDRTEAAGRREMVKAGAGGRARGVNILGVDALGLLAERLKPQYPTFGRPCPVRQ